MRKILSLFAFLFLVTTAHATTRTAATCNAADIQTQVNASSDGDIVQIPAGNCTWSTAVTVTVGITIQPVPAAVVTLTMNEVLASCGTLTVTADTGASFFFTGFNVFGAGIPGVCPAPITVTTTASTKTYRIYGNTFDDNSPTAGAVIIRHTGIGPGLIDSNVFNTHTCNDETIHNWGSGTPTDGSTWTTDVVPGSLLMLFVESNIYNHILATPTSNSCVTSSISQYYGSRTTIRYNTYNNGYYIDAHMGNATTGTGARWWEIYQNTSTLPGTQSGQQFHQGTYFNLRGGSGLVYNNHSTGTPFQNQPPGCSFGQLSGSSDQQTGSWPLAHQIGRGLNENYSPSYSWGNDWLTTGCGSSFPSYVQIGTTLTSALCVANGTTGHSAAFCDGVDLGKGAMPTLTRCEAAADVCPQTYTYQPAPFPHPLRAAASTSLSITPVAPINFGTVNTGSTKTITITVTNIGNATNTLTSPTFASGTSYSVIAGGTCAPGALAASATCTYFVQFAPTTQGTLTDTITVHGTTNVSAALTGVGQNSVSVPSTPTSLAATGSGGAGAPISLSWTASIGTPSITYNCLVSPPSSGSGGPYTIFVTTSNTTCPFTPSTTGVYNFEVSATNSAGTSTPTAPIAFTVNPATSPSASLSLTTFNFPDTTLGGTSGPFIITLTNVGTANLVVSSVTIPTFTDFSVTQSPNPCGTLAPNATCALGVSFAPSSLGAQQASLNVASNDPVNPTLSTTLNATGTGNVILTPASINFPNVYPNQSSVAQVFTLTNNTASTITLSSVALTTGTQFTLSNGCGGTLAPGPLTTCNITVTFAPTSQGTKTDTLTVIFTGAGGGTLTSTVSGNANNHKVKKGVVI